jgi:2'-5' RNA ligase
LQLPKTSGLAVWLLPAPDQSRLLSKFISNLSEQYSSIPFVPHITLSSVPDIPSKKITEMTERLSEELNQLQVDLGDVECRPHPYRKVILSIDDNVMVSAFYNKVNQAFGGEICKEGDFHLSLLYGNQRCEEIELGNIRSELPITNKLYIQSIAVVDLNFTPDKWKIIFERSLQINTSL